jgi:regulator of sigma E protease
MQFLETVLYFVITLGVLVFVHEFGHFITAKLCGMRVDRFSIGFPPRAFGKTFGETDYCISWIPVGGYVKIAGMIDESFDTEFLSAEPQPWEFRARPIWQRMLVISGGVIMNILLAVAIFWGINYVQGKLIRETTEIGVVLEGSPAAHSGLQSGDRVLRVNGADIAAWDDILNDVYIEHAGDDIEFTVLRHGEEIQLRIPRTSIPDPADNAFGIIPTHTEIVVTTVQSGLPADKMGLKPGDILLSINGIALGADTQVKPLVQANAGKPIAVEWKRGPEKLAGTTIPTTEGMIGIGYGLRYNGPVRKIQYSLLQAFPRAWSDVYSVSILFVKQVGQIISGKIAFSQSVGGPIKIAQMATQTAELGLLTYLGFMALLSMSLAILNFLPFPALDGGHMVFLVYEAIFRREIPVKVRMGLQKAGFVLLLAFMAFVVYNDLRHF